MARLLIRGHANGSSCPWDGWYVAAYDPSQPSLDTAIAADLYPDAITSEHVLMVFTPHRAHALDVPWETFVHLYRAVHHPCPDYHGHPCRPITAYNIEVVNREAA